MKGSKREGWGLEVPILDVNLRDKYYDFTYVDGVRKLEFEEDSDELKKFKDDESLKQSSVLTLLLFNILNKYLND